MGPEIQVASRRERHGPPATRSAARRPSGRMYATTAEPSSGQLGVGRGRDQVGAQPFGGSAVRRRGDAFAVRPCEQREAAGRDRDGVRGRVGHVEGRFHAGRDHARGASHRRGAHVVPARSRLPHAPGRGRRAPRVDAHARRQDGLHVATLAAAAVEDGRAGRAVRPDRRDHQVLDGNVRDLARPDLRGGHPAARGGREVVDRPAKPDRAAGHAAAQHEQLLPDDDRHRAVGGPGRDRALAEPVVGQAPPRPAALAQLGDDALRTPVPRDDNVSGDSDAFGCDRRRVGGDEHVGPRARRRGERQRNRKACHAHVEAAR